MLKNFIFNIVNGLIPKKIYVDILDNTYNYIKDANEKNERVNFSGLSKTISKMLASKYEQGN